MPASSREVQPMAVNSSTTEFHASSPRPCSHAGGIGARGSGVGMPGVVVRKHREERRAHAPEQGPHVACVTQNVVVHHQLEPAIREDRLAGGQGSVSIFRLHADQHLEVFERL